MTARRPDSVELLLLDPVSPPTVPSVVEVVVRATSRPIPIVNTSLTRKSMAGDNAIVVRFSLCCTNPRPCWMMIWPACPSTSAGAGAADRGATAIVRGGDRTGGAARLPRPAADFPGRVGRHHVLVGDDPGAAVGEANDHAVRKPVHDRPVHGLAPPEDETHGSGRADSRGRTGRLRARLVGRKPLLRPHRDGQRHNRRHQNELPHV